MLLARLLPRSQKIQSGRFPGAPGVTLLRVLGGHPKVRESEVSMAARVIEGCKDLKNV